MKSFSAIVAIALATALPAFAQSVLDLPQCAQNDVLLAIGTSGCVPTDFECICKKKSFVDSLAVIIPKKCTLEETYSVSSFAIVFCDATGVTIDLPADIQSPVGGASSTTSVVVSTSSSVIAATTSTSSSNGTTSGTQSVTRAVLTSTSTAAVTTSTSPAAGAVQTAGLVGLMGAVFVGVMGL